MYDFYEEPRKLNIKKVVIISIIFVIILFSIIFSIVRKITNNKNNENQIEAKKSTTIFYSEDKSTSIELPNSLKLKNYNSNLNYLLELRSDDYLNIFIEKESTLPNKQLSEIIEADKLAFLNNFPKNSNLSETKALSVNNNLAYTYSFHYLDENLNKAFYLQIAWLQIDNLYYIFNIEFPLDDLSFHTNIVSSVLSNFKTYQK